MDINHLRAEIKELNESIISKKSTKFCFDFINDNNFNLDNLAEVKHYQANNFSKSQNSNRSCNCVNKTKTRKNSYLSQTESLTPENRNFKQLYKEKILKSINDIQTSAYINNIETSDKGIQLINK